MSPESSLPGAAGVPHDLFDAHPAPTFVVDDDLRVLRINRAARTVLRHAADATPLSISYGGDALGCVHANGVGGCGRQDACKGCVIRSSVDQAISSGAVRRARTVLRLRRDGRDRDVSVLVSASPLLDAGTVRALLTFEGFPDLDADEEIVLSPAGEVSSVELGDMLDAEALCSMMQQFYKLARIPMSIIDARGKVLAGVGWQDICTKFHRVNPETCRHCIESDTQLTAGVPPGEIRRYKCKNNMWDVATPILVGGHHAGNVFTGQFFFEDEPLDYDVFRAQAARYGFNEVDYLAALEAVPRLSRDSVAAGMQFLLTLAGMLSQSSYSNLKLARSAAERETLLVSLRESKERLEQADRRKTEFLAVLSHELRNPLAPIRNSLFLLDRARPGSAQAARARSIMSRQVEHLSRLVDDLLDVTRISHGKVLLKRERVDLRDLVRASCEDNRTAFEQREIEMHLDLPFGPVCVDADPTRVSQVVGNLLQNAAKFTPCGGRVMVAVSCRHSCAEVSVRDTGVGVEPTELERIFHPFVQADQGLARTQGGLGLGLALVKALVEMHGGSVEARSDGLGHGAEFIVRFPVAPVPATAHQRLASAEARGLAVLVIEDNADAGESLADIMTMYGHRVHLALDAHSGLALARKLRPDVVLCDIGLPDLDGYEVARAIRSDVSLHTTRLIALTGYAADEDRERARAAGFDAHVAKPPDIDKLMKLLGTE